jgi:hypothetical protein
MTMRKQGTYKELVGVRFAYSTGSVTFTKTLVFIMVEDGILGDLVIQNTFSMPISVGFQGTMNQYRAAFEPALVAEWFRFSGGRQEFYFQLEDGCDPARVGFISGEWHIDKWMPR